MALPTRGEIAHALRVFPAWYTEIGGPHPKEPMDVRLHVWFGDSPGDERWALTFGVPDWDSEHGDVVAASVLGDSLRTVVARDLLTQIDDAEGPDWSSPEDQAVDA
jgi:hypothetical protein